jgi:transposase
MKYGSVILTQKWHYRPRNGIMWQKARTVLLAGKVMYTVFCNTEGCTLVNFLSKGKTINMACHSQMLKLLHAPCDKRPRKKTIVLQHNNARPHTACLTSEIIAKNGWKVLLHPPNCPDLTPSDRHHHLFGAIEDLMRRQHYEKDDAIHEAMCSWLWSAGTDLYWSRIFKLVQCWQKFHLTKGGTKLYNGHKYVSTYEFLPWKCAGIRKQNITHVE